MVGSGSSSNPLFIGVTTTTTNTIKVLHDSKVDATTQFCLSCGAWIEIPEELSDLPWYFCEWCTPKEPAKIRVSKKSRNQPKYLD